jgi:hypothetical protein
MLFLKVITCLFLYFLSPFSRADVKKYIYIIYGSKVFKGVSDYYTEIVIDLMLTMN